jgi:hypothetical protein
LNSEGRRADLAFKGLFYHGIAILLDPTGVAGDAQE